MAGIGLGFIAFLLDWNHIYPADFMLIAFLLFVTCLGIMVATSFVFPEPLQETAVSLVWEDWRAPLRGAADGGMGGSVVVLSAVIFVFATLYLIFR